MLWAQDPLADAGGLIGHNRDMPTLATTAAKPVDIEQAIRIIRGQRVMLDADLAQLYEVPTRALQAVRRNPSRFPDDLAFELTAEEFAALRSQTVTSKHRAGRSSISPKRFHGAGRGDTLERPGK